MEMPRVLAFACVEAGLVLLGAAIGLSWSEGQSAIGDPEYTLWTYRDGAFQAWYGSDEGKVVGDGRGLLVAGGPILATALLLTLAAATFLMLRRGRATAACAGGAMLLTTLGTSLMAGGIVQSTRSVGGEYHWGSSLYLAIGACVLLLATAILPWKVRPLPKAPKAQAAAAGPRTFRMTAGPATTPNQAAAEAPVLEGPSDVEGVAPPTPAKPAPPARPAATFTRTPPAKK